MTRFHHPLLIGIGPFLLIALLGIRGGADASRSGFDESIMDRSVQPGDDFYRFACGKWIDEASLPDGVPRYNTYSEMDDAMIATVIRILAAASVDSSGSGNSTLQKLGDFFASALDTVTLDREGASPLSGEMALIDEVSNREDLQRVITRFQLMGINPLFRIDEVERWRLKENYQLLLRPAGLGLPGAHYYVRSDSTALSLLNDYSLHIAGMFELLGEEPAAALQKSGVVLAIEKQIAESHFDRSGKSRGGDYKEHSVTALERLMPAFDWEAWLEETGASPIDKIHLDNQDYFKKLDRIVNETLLNDWKTYLQWVLVDNCARFLSRPFREAGRRFYSVRLRGYTRRVSREELAFFAIDGTLPEGIGRCYVDEAFPPEARARIMEMIDNLRAAFRARIEGSPEIGDKEKNRYLRKLETLKFQIGGPEKSDDFATLEIDRHQYLENILRSRRYNMTRRIARFGRPVDYERWNVYPQSMSGWYSADQNRVTYPAASMQFPLFVPGGDLAANYAGMGSSIAHEISHGFDIQGRQFDEKGKHRGWWAWLKSRFTHDHREKILIEQFDSCEALEGHFVSGKGTLMENMADHGGLTIAWDAMQIAVRKGAPDKTIGDFTLSQRFFLAYAQKWKEVIDEEHLIRTLAGPHAPTPFRAVSPLTHHDAFYEAFGITAESPVWREKSERVELW